MPPWENIGTHLPLSRRRRDLVLEVIRTLTGQPRFLQRAPDPAAAAAGSTRSSTSPTNDCLLYRLPAYAPQRRLPVFIPEGEKDVDRCMMKVRSRPAISAARANGGLNMPSNSATSMLLCWPTTTTGRDRSRDRGGFARGCRGIGQNSGTAGPSAQG